MTLDNKERPIEEKYNFNDDVITYVLIGDPTPLARARMGKGRCWDSQKKTKLVHGITLKAQHGQRPAYSGPLSVSMTFFCPIPPSRERKIKPGCPHAVKPDLDNLIKYICDVAQDILFENDSRVAQLLCKKVYSRQPRTEFTITVLEQHEKI